MSLEPWKPSRREQQARWWVDLLGKFIKSIVRLVGTAGVVYTLFVKPDPVGMLVSGSMAVSLDIGQFAIGLFRAARDEAKEIQRIAREGRDSSE